MFVELKNLSNPASAVSNIIKKLEPFSGTLEDSFSSIMKKLNDLGVQITLNADKAAKGKEGAEAYGIYDKAEKDLSSAIKNVENQIKDVVRRTGVLSDAELDEFLSFVQLILEDKKGA